MIANLSVAAKPFSHSSFAGLAFLGLAILPALQAASSTLADSGEFVVYLGLDVSANVNGATCPVVSGGENAVRVLAKGRTVSLSVRQAQLTSAATPKLSRARVTLEGLVGDRVYSLANDPGLDAISQQMVMETAQSHAQEVREIKANATAQTAAIAERLANDPTSTVTRADVDAANRVASNAASDLNTSRVAPAFRSSLPGKVDEGSTFDGFEMSFRISATEEHADAYGVLRLLIRVPAKPANLIQVIKFFNVRKLGPKARKVTVRQMGLPEGFAIDSYTVHIYADGLEIPTNVSPKRLDVEAGEAHQFLVIRHIQANRQSTIPAQVIRELSSGELRKLVSKAALGTSVDLHIDGDGRVTKVEPAAIGGGPLSSDLESTLLKVRMLPALVNGTPVASEGNFTLEDLAG